MTRPFPDAFKAQLSGDALTVSDEDGAFLYCVDARWLMEKLLRGETCNAKERAAAGVALRILLHWKPLSPADVEDVVIGMIGASEHKTITSLAAWEEKFTRHIELKSLALNGVLPPADDDCPL